MLSFSQSHFARYFCAVPLVCLSLLILFQVEMLATQAPYALFFVAVTVAAWVGGRGSGIVSIVLSTLAAVFVLIPSIGSASFALADVIQLTGFVLIASLLVYLTATLKKNTVTAKESEIRYGFLFDGNPYPLCVVDPKTLRFLAVNTAATNVYGYSSDEFLRLTVPDVILDENAFRLIEADSTSKSSNGPINVSTHKRKDGTTFYVEMRSHELVFSGFPARVIHTVDVTERISTSDALKASEARLLKVFGACPVSVTVNRWSDGVFLEANPEFSDLTGWEPVALIGRTAVECEIVSTETAARLRSNMTDRLTIVDEEIELTTRSGKIRKVVLGAVLVEMDGEQRVITTFVDVTELRQAEERHQLSEERLRMVTEKARVGLVMINDRRRFTFVNTAYADLFNLPPANLVGRRVADVHVDLFERQLSPSLDRAFAGESFSYELRRPTGDGDRFYDVRYEPTRLKGVVSSVVAVVTDITEQMRTELARQASEERYHTLFEYAPDGIAIANYESRYLDVNEALCRMLGYTRDELIGLHASNIFVPKDIPHLGETLRGLNSDLEYYQEWQYRRKDGSTFPGEVVATTMPDGNTLTVIRDTTERKQLEEQLLQAQKMEAIGVLAGGVAHDFNNILTAISGYSELTLQRMPANDPFRDYIVEINEAGMRAADLTSQLLAFSRRKVLTPAVHNLNTTVTDTERMLRPIVKENIEFRIDLEQDLGNIKVDPGQIAQVLVNLVVNAGDAMPNGGTLSIKTRNVRLDGDCPNENTVLAPGQFVELTVTDTGCGMDAQTLRRLFEPFYTTKEIGKGTGLGLSTVYGIVKQSGGDITVESEPGRGTTFKVYLPCVFETFERTRVASENRHSSCGSETILLVEDEVSVRNLVNNILTRNGYKVLAVDGAEAALGICQTYPDKIHLLLTDMIMPRMDGAELRDEVVKIRPGIRSLFMSGYTGDTLINDGIQKTETALIEKPFAPDELIRKIHDVMGIQANLTNLPSFANTGADVAKAASR